MSFQFKIGDVVECVNAYGTSGLEHNRQYTVLGVDHTLVLVGTSPDGWFNHRFILVGRENKPTHKSRLKAGDRIILSRKKEDYAEYQTAFGYAIARDFYDIRPGVLTIERVDTSNPTPIVFTTDGGCFYEPICVKVSGGVT